MFVVKRSEHNPILTPTPEHAFENFAVLNGNPIKIGSLINILYRAQTFPEKFENGSFSMSTVCKAVSKDGIYFRNKEVFIFPENSWERYGCEDPRVTKIDRKYFIFYTALSAYPLNLASGIKVGLAISKDFKSITEKHLITPFNAKAMTLFPEKINGKYVTLLTVNPDILPTQIALAEFENIEQIWSEDYWKKWYKELDRHIFMPGDNIDRIEIGSCPIKTKEGLLLVCCRIQNHAAPKRVIAIEAVLLDLKDPKKIIGKTRGALLVPEEKYEKEGLQSNIIFPSGVIIAGDKLNIYYGATDTTIAVASVDLSRLLQSMKFPYEEIGFERSSHSSLLYPRNDKSWEKKAIFNPAAILIDDKISILYRAMSDDNTSVIGYAESPDGITIKYQSDKPIYTPRESFEEKRVAGGNSGCEDPRLTQIGNTIYMYYVAYNGVTPPSVAQTHISKGDFKKRKWKWTKPVLVTADGVDDKDGCLHPEKVADKYFLFHRVRN